MFGQVLLGLLHCRRRNDYPSVHNAVFAVAYMWMEKLFKHKTEDKASHGASLPGLFRLYERI